LKTTRISLTLFAFWILLSGKFDAVHLGLGLISAGVIAIATARLERLPPPIGRSAGRPFDAVHWGRVLLYVPWLAWEVVISALQVARLIVQPRMPIAPRLVRFDARLPHTLARLTLSSSITLTPGTVTLDVEEDEFLVHALTPDSARKLELGQMRNRVAELFRKADPADGSGPRS
jgi:multicomponent Na+:H+ antiporter subunit E